MSRLWSRRASRHLFSASAVVWIALGGAFAHADATKFAVVNLSPNTLPAPVVAEAEREYKRLRPGSTPLADPAMHGLLATGESPARALPRLVDEARRQREAGNCAEAVPAALRAEEVALSSIPVDDSREPLKTIYTVLVACETSLDRPEPRDQAARRLRALVSSAPAGLPTELWDAHVANAVPAPATVELQVDSEPPNAQIIVNFHAQGTTPRTLKVPPGEVLVEVQKDGYKKAFRRLEAKDSAIRTVFRLADVRLDRTELVANALRALEREESIDERQRTLAQLAQWTRVDTLVLVRSEGTRLVMRFFDAERGALAQETIISPYDAETGRIEVLARRGDTDAGRPAGSRPGILAPVSANGHAGGAPGLEPAAPSGLQQTYREPPPPRPRRERTSGPWWGWLIAAAVAGGIAAVVLSDRTTRSDTIDVNAGF